MRHLLTSLAILATFAAAGQVDGFQLPYNPDVEPDGYIGTADLLELLTVFGDEFSSDELIVSTDSSSLIVYVGDVTAIGCLSFCANLEGNWRVITPVDIVQHLGQLALSPVDGCPESWEGHMWVNKGFVTDDWKQNGYRLSTQYRHPVNGKPPFVDCENGSADLEQELECWCATQERPRVEYTQCIGDGEYILNCVQEKTQQGWYPLDLIPFGSNNMIQTLWRWAE